MGLIPLRWLACLVCCVLPAAASLTKPYAFSGAFARTYYGVSVDVGDNVVRVTATDPIVGGTGYAELTTEITAADLLPNQNSSVTLLYTDVRATLDFGTNIHTLADLATNTVRLVFEVLSLNQHFTNDLLCVTNALTNGIVLLKSSQAWVSLTDTNTLADYLRGDVRGAHLLAAVSVPAYGSYATLFDLHETGDATSVFTSDYYALALGFPSRSSPIGWARDRSVVARVCFTSARPVRLWSWMRLSQLCRSSSFLHPVSQSIV